MSALVYAVGSVWISFVAVLVLALLVEVLAGWRARPPARRGDVQPPFYGVLMPAHNEAGTIRATILAVLRQLPPWGRLLVIADNCSDGTAAEARAAGAQVEERSDLLLRGKGHALAFGVAHWRSDPPEVVVILDADCIPAPGALDLLAATAASSADRPVQALYLMSARPGSSLRVRMAAFAWAVRNQLRPLGMHRLGLPCQLMGSGMAFTWPCLASVELASGHLTEDLQLGVKLAAAGQAPRFCPEACVESWFPEQKAALDAQHTRWEHGHLSMILAGAPSLLWHGGRTGNAGALALALDLCIPPLALLALLLLVSCGFAGWMASGGAVGRVAAAVATGCVLCFTAAVLLGWWSVGRRWVSFAELAFAPIHVLRKLPVYLAFVFRRQKEWVRTSREP
ncbi:glycosyltransferase family 2 protein [Ramlibacter monticola]|uniref:Glycosyltransferase n=1 Tax=Ramlibacter monticola TaxID=1926872 RepID=A0A936Z1M9_9BURK|nr:glycosyltransferase family 2 protein [Ramlibacter monticola]MBL0392020.1 glycosyltransferase [Ramlibacter monticola]